MLSARSAQCPSKRAFFFNEPGHQLSNCTGYIHAIAILSPQLDAM